MSGMVGVGNLVHSVIRFSFSFTETVADLYFTSMLLVFMDSFHLFVALRPMQPDKVPLPYLLVAVVGWFYEVYVFAVARRMYLSRKKQKDLLKDE
uniref:Uncharacterized protein n=1 Tax=Grammatophora oceanica TaxID=210454 RepID=A0A7S1YLK8_9STRA